MVWRRVLILVLACVPVFAVPSAAGAQKLRKPRVQSISELYVLNAGSGTLTPVRGHQRVFTLTFMHVERRVVWFQDRPARNSGTFPSPGLTAYWKGFGFAADPPNAALVYPAPHGDGSTVIFTLTHPRYSKRSGTLAFTARWLDPTKVTDPNLRRHAKNADPTPDRAFHSPSLFIDAATAQIIDGCPIEPGTQCTNADFSGADLSGADLQGADFGGSSTFLANNFSGANLSGVNFSGAWFGEANNFSGADLQGANFDRGISSVSGPSSFQGANLSGAQLVNVDFVGSNFTNANLTGDNLDGANLDHSSFTNADLTNVSAATAVFGRADFTNANLTGASFQSLAGANLSGATWCHTTIGGQVNNSSCPLTVQSFSNGVLTITRSDGSTVSGTVSADTDLECGGKRCSTSNLTPGAAVQEAILSSTLTPGAIVATWQKVDLVS